MILTDDDDEITPTLPRVARCPFCLNDAAQLVANGKTAAAGDAMITAVYRHADCPNVGHARHVALAELNELRPAGRPRRRWRPRRRSGG